MVNSAEVPVSAKGDSQDQIQMDIPGVENILQISYLALQIRKTFTLFLQLHFSKEKPDALFSYFGSATTT